MTRNASVLLLGLTLVVPTGSTAEDIGTDTTWQELREDGYSLVFGRLEGRFDGPEYRGRKIRVRNKQTGDEHSIPIEEGLGYFEAALPAGTYALVAIEAVYFPRMRPMKPDRYPPVRQRYAIEPLPDAGLPSFPVVADRPLYLGTIRSGLGTDGIVYQGHELEIVDERQEALDHLRLSHAGLVDSFERSGVEPESYFFLKPKVEPSPLELVDSDDPIGRARDYIAEGKYEQALSWLMTFMPATDQERAKVKLLVGEALLAARKYREAIEELGEVLLADPENMRALRLLARAHAFNGNEESAHDLYQALAESLPNDAEASLQLGYRFALGSEAELAREAFESAFRDNFDYLLHDLSPYAQALKRDGADYEPPEVLDGAVKPPSTMRSRRSSRGAFALLIDHEGRVVAAHMTPDAEGWAPAMMMSVIRARFRPARLNGVRIPCLVIVGADNVIRQVQ